MVRVMKISCCSLNPEQIEQNLQTKMSDLSCKGEEHRCLISNREIKQGAWGYEPEPMLQTMVAQPSPDPNVQKKMGLLALAAVKAQKGLRPISLPPPPFHLQSHYREKGKTDRKSVV